MAGLACDQSKPERAARLFGAARALREGIGTRVPPVRESEYERDLAKTRTALGPTRFATASDSGSRLSADEAVAFADHSPEVGVPVPPREVLTRREREVAALVARGYTNREIAERLVISERTADGHVANILAKLGLKSRAQVAVWIVQEPKTGT
jgi:non-specific serine/threonine protein kinase